MKESTRGVYSHYNNTQLLKAYKEGYERVNDCLTDLNENDLKTNIIDGKWTIAQILIHLVDSEIVGACRIRLAFCEHHDKLPYYNQDVWAERMSYNGFSMEDIHNNLSLFKYLRITTYKLMSKFDSDDWKKQGYHPERGPVTIRELLELYADHSERHIQQILERRALLNKPKNLELILNDRLY